MSQYPGGQPPQDPYYGQQGADPYAPPPPSPEPSDPYFGQGGADPYGQPYDPVYAQQQAAQYAQQQAYYAQQQAAQAQQRAFDEARGGRGGAGAAIVGLLLVLAGAWILFGDEVDLDFAEVWPIGAVTLGIIMVIAAFIPRRER
jgi:hypothetical protein